MGKGSGTCATRSSMNLFESHNSIKPETPGKSKRAQFTYALLEAASQLSPELILRDLDNPSSTVASHLADAPDMIHNVFMDWIPSSYQGWDGYDPEHEELRKELFYAILLDGDRKAEHTYFYRDKESQGEWTLGAGNALRGWYRLPIDNSGAIVPGGLKQSVQAVLDKNPPLFLESLRQKPSDTLARCCDIAPQETSPKEIFDRLNEYDSEFKNKIGNSLLESPSSASASLYRLNLKNALDLCEQAQLDKDQSKLLIETIRYMPIYGTGQIQNTQELEMSNNKQAIIDLIKELSPLQSDQPEVYITKPNSKLGKLLADVQQSWLASPLCDLAAEQQRRIIGNQDQEFWLQRSRCLAVRAPWHSSEGRKNFQALAKRQETRIRSILGLYHRQKTPSAPKGWKQLKPVS